MDALNAANSVLEWATTALVPMLLGLLTLAARTYISTRSHDQALAAVTGALERAAAVAAAELLSGGGPVTPKEAAQGMVQYVERGLPGAVAKLKPADGALEAMAEAVLQQWLQKRADARDRAG